MLQRRLRWALPLLIAVALVLIVVVDLNLAPGSALATASQVLFPVLVGLLAGGLMLLRLRARKLATAGALGLEAARVGAVPAGAPLPVAAADGEFTVPYGTLMAPETRSPGSLSPPIGPAGEVELRGRRGPAVFSLVVILVGGTCLLGSLATMIATVATSGVEGPLGHHGAARRRAAHHRRVVRPARRAVDPGATSAGAGPVHSDRLGAAELPPGWAVERRARDGRAGDNPERRVCGPAGVPARMVVLQLRDPDRALGRVGPVTRWLLRRTRRRYGSPVVIMAGPRSPMQLDQLLATLAHYSTAPIRWT